MIRVRLFRALYDPRSPPQPVFLEWGYGWQRQCLSFALSLVSVVPIFPYEKVMQTSGEPSKMNLSLPVTKQKPIVLCLVDWSNAVSPPWTPCGPGSSNVQLLMESSLLFSQGTLMTFTAQSFIVIILSSFNFQSVSAILDLNPSWNVQHKLEAKHPNNLYGVQCV